MQRDDSASYDITTEGYPHAQAARAHDFRDAQISDIDNAMEDVGHVEG
jgi:hypothetical protein